MCIIRSFTSIIKSESTINTFPLYNWVLFSYLKVWFSFKLHLCAYVLYKTTQRDQWKLAIFKLYSFVMITLNISHNILLQLALKQLN